MEVNEGAEVGAMGKEGSRRQKVIITCAITYGIHTFHLPFRTGSDSP